MEGETVSSTSSVTAGTVTAGTATTGAVTTGTVTAGTVTGKGSTAGDKHSDRREGRGGQVANIQDVFSTSSYTQRAGGHSAK